MEKNGEKDYNKRSYKVCARHYCSHEQYYVCKFVQTMVWTLTAVVKYVFLSRLYSGSEEPCTSSMLRLTCTTCDHMLNIDVEKGKKLNIWKYFSLFVSSVSILYLYSSIGVILHFCVYIPYNIFVASILENNTL